MRRVKCVFVSLCLTSALFGCAEIDKGLKRTVDSLAPPDIVTGKRTLNLEPESDELKRATSQTTELLRSWRTRGLEVDTDSYTLSKLQTMMRRIVAVSHRPHLPWEIHLVQASEVNAFTIGGGKVFVYRGLFGGLVEPTDENELAAVLAHEIAHVTARHVGKTQALQLVAAVSRGTRREIGERLFQASFSTLQEDEADRIGLLYMALAGYDPRAAAQVWWRAHIKSGSDPGDYSYDHALNIQRFEKTRTLIPIAMKYFRGQGVKNADYDRLRVENDLIPQTGSFAGESGVLTLLEAGLGAYSDYLNAKNEKLQRETMRQQARLPQQIRIINVRLANTADGHRGIFGEVHNAGNQVIRGAEITVYYYNAQGQVLYMEPLPLGSLYLQPGSVKPWGTYLKNVPGMSHAGAAVTRID